jgi:hypothetical protein
MKLKNIGRLSSRQGCRDIYKCPHPALALWLRLPSPKFGRGVGGEGKGFQSLKRPMRLRWRVRRVGAIHELPLPVEPSAFQTHQSTFEPNSPIPP